MWKRMAWYWLLMLQELLSSISLLGCFAHITKLLENLKPSKKGLNSACEEGWGLRQTN